MTLLIEGDYVKCIAIATDWLLDENISITNHPWDRSILRTDGGTGKRSNDINSQPTRGVDNNPPIFGSWHCPHCPHPPRSWQTAPTSCGAAWHWWAGTCVTTQFPVSATQCHTVCVTTSRSISSPQRALSRTQVASALFKACARTRTTLLLASIALNYRLKPRWTTGRGSFRLKAAKLTAN